MARNDGSDTDDPGRGVWSVTARAADEQESPEVRARREARRRVIAGGLASAPLILTLTSRPALGGGHKGGGGQAKKCGYSGLLSGNLSHDHVDNSTWCKGKTPRYWKMKEDDCNRHFVVGPVNPLYMDNWECDDYSIPSEEELIKFRENLAKDFWRNWQKIRQVDQYLEWLSRYPTLDSPPFGTPFAEIFGEGIASNLQLTLMQALWLDEEPPYQPSGGTGPQPLLAHIAAAYCNACQFGKESYGYGPDELVDKVVSEFHLDPLGLEERLRLMNDQG